MRAVDFPFRRVSNHAGFRAGVNPLLRRRRKEQRGQDLGRNRVTSIGAMTCGLMLAASVTGFSAPAGAASRTPTTSSGVLPFTGAPLLFELCIGAGAVRMGLAISRFGRRRAGGSV